MTGIRLQVWLAKSGVASRRHAETLITGGQVTVNGAVVKQLGTRVDPVRDRVAVRGQPVAAQPVVYWLLNKPKGYVTTAADPQGRPTVFTLLGATPARLFAVGRLDFNTEGALLLTNDGELAHRLMHPRQGVDKVYQAKLRGKITRDQVARLRQGVVLPALRDPDEPASAMPRRVQQRQKGPQASERSAPCEVRLLGETRSNTWLELTLHEGKNRQVHRMAAAIGSSLLKLVRTAYAGLSVEGLEVGGHRPLTEAEVTKLRALAGLLPLPEHEERPGREKQPERPKRRKPGPGWEEAKAPPSPGRARREQMVQRLAREILGTPKP